MGIVGNFKGLKGDKGDAGSAGISGDMIQNYGGSLVKNGALELGTLEGWTGAIMGDGFNQLASSVKTSDSAECSSKFQVVLDQVYKIEYYVKNEGAGLTVESGGVGLDSFDSNGNKLNGSQRIFPHGLSNWSISNSTTFVKKVLYFGGLGTSGMNFSSNPKFVSPFVFKIKGPFISVNGLIINKLSLGEAVPYTLPYLPTGQTVFDPATNKVGRFNGTDVNWFM